MISGRRKLRLAGVAAAAALALAAAGCGSSGGAPPGSGGGGKTVKGGTVTWAEPPQAQPNWIWPYAPITNYSTYNSQSFQWLMYRPLYMFGNNGNSVNINYPLSTASAPVYSDGGKTVTINMKGWKWSDGETVDAQDVIFWLNMMKAEKANYAGYAPGLMPDNLVSYKATSPSQVVLHLNKDYSSFWFTYNQLAEITPMPLAWDVTSLGAKAGSGGCSTSVSKCAAVYKFLLAQTKDTATYATSKIWGTVDGPWKLSSFNTAGDDDFVPNKAYSGSPKPTIAQFDEVPFTDDSATYTALKTGKLDIGTIPDADLPQKPANGAVPAQSANPLGSAYKLAPLYAFGIYYYQPNFNNPTFGAVFKQLYVRQALQSVDDQVGMDNTIFRGYSVPTSGGVPTTPSNQWTPAIQNSNDAQGPYPFSIAKAKSLFASHGWKMVGGVQTCENPSACGAGITKGEQMKFSLDWSTGVATTQQEVAIYKSDASKAGISISLVGQSFNTIIGESTPCKPGPKCTWDALMYGGWLFNGPGMEPTGEPLFQTGAGSNSGSYSNPTEDKLIEDTHTKSSLAVFHQYGTFTADQLPYIWMPNQYYVEAVSSNLHNVTFNSLYTLLPEYWKLSK
jgi:peptide/nickel transport system substrate-binding protein